MYAPSKRNLTLSLAALTNDDDLHHDVFRETLAPTTRDVSKATVTWSGEAISLPHLLRRMPAVERKAKSLGSAMPVLGP